jgi:hypothetical protein
MLGYEPLMQALLSLAYKCIGPVATRPFLNWICIILKSILNVLDEIQR